MRFGKGLSTFKNCTVAEGKQNKEMENSYAKGNRNIQQETWKTAEEKEKIQKER
jgi:outer membrane protein assembly factor BamD (BamD/ComL family)